jgi:hypothetical protein
MMEVTPEYRNAVGETAVTESGRVNVSKEEQQLKRLAGIAVNCDGVSNATDASLEHLSKTQSPRVETEEGTVKDVRWVQRENA